MPNNDVTVTALTRKFLFEGRELADFNPDADPETIKGMHAATTPELASAIIEGPELVEGARVYTFKKRLGTKG